MEHLCFHITGFEPLLDQLPSREVANGLYQGVVSDIIKCAFYVGIYDPWPGGTRPCQAKQALDRIVATPARAKPLAAPLEPRFPEWFQGVFHHGLHTPIHDGGNAERPVAFALGDIDPTNRVDMMTVELAELLTQLSSFFRRGHEDVIHAGPR